jgi:hypothetical protein
MVARLVGTGAVLWLAALSGCANQAAAHDEAVRNLQWYRDNATQLQAQTTLMRVEIDNLRAALLERYRRESDLWRAFVELAARVSQLSQSQQASQSDVESSQAMTELVPTSSQSDRQVPIRALLRAINRLELSPEQKQALIQLLYPPRPIDGDNPWKSESTW